MKNLILVSALATGLGAMAPAAANAAEPVIGLSVGNGHVSGSLTLIAHDDRYRGRYGRPYRGRYCLNWRQTHRRLHRRFDRVGFQRSFYNRRGQRIYIARARNHRGYPVRVRYNACMRRVTRVTPLRGRHHGRYHIRRNWRR